MSDARISAHAEVLVKYSLRLKRGEQLVIVAEEPAAPLVREVYRAALETGAHVRVQMVPTGLDEIFYSVAKPDQLTWLSPAAVAEARAADAFLNIYSQSNTRALTGVDPAKLVTAGKARRKIRDIILNKRWCLTLHPTHAYAQDAEMSLADFERFVYGAVFADTTDPVKQWKALSRRQDRLVKRLTGAERIHIEGPDTDLVMSVKGRRFVNSDGVHNMPSGEVFTAPVAASVEGRVRFSFPVCFRGREVEDVRLVFRKGRVAEATARRGQTLLRTMLATDPGASRLGELGIGTNYGIRSFTKNILFDEKIGGTVHLAVGSAYKECGGRNRSALHWDMILDLRAQGRVTVDGKPLIVDGKFTGNLFPSAK